MLAPGTRLGPYEILALIGEGGMGQVFKARDTRLDRMVAIKMLPAAVAGDRVRSERLEREARHISRLEHPHICPLYDVGEHNGHLYLVMQFLEGETLADRLQRGPLTISQTLEYGIQIADALATAHRAGIVHRDLKPGNVMLTRTGARLLDFGLARPVLASGSLKTTTGDRAHRASTLTAEGTILGTVSYMAPEQIEGRDVDTRADVFAFGAVLFEMVTGLKAFEGENAARVMSAILRDEPARVSSIVPVTPSALEALIHACLAKDPNERWQNISDVARQLRHLRDMMSGAKSGSSPALISQGHSRSILRRMNLGWVAAALLGAATVGLLIDRARSEPPSAPPLQLHAFMPPPEGMYLTSTLAVSHDGGRLAFVAADATGKRRLWVQSLRTPTPHMLADTDEASDPFWSPDGEHVAFFAGRRLKRVPAGGGAVTTVCEIGAGAGGTWNAENVIVFGQLEGPLMRVSAGGGRPEPITALDRDRVETHHLYPNFLPDGRHFVFYINSRERGLYVGAVDSDRRTRLFDPDPALPAGAAPTPGVYSSSGHLLYVRDRVLMVRRFDPTTFQVSGEPLTIVKTVDYDPPGQAAFTSANGILVYRARHHRPLAVLAWVDRAGRALGEIASPPGTFRTLSLSPDGRTVAIDRLDAQGLPSVWLIDAAQGTSARLTSTYWSGDPLWSHDGRLLAYSVAADSPPNIVIRADGGRGAERRITRQPTEQHYATSFTPDGRHLVFHAISAMTGHDLYFASIVEENVVPQRLLQTRFNESHGRVSPDGRWLVYVSDDTGQQEVYLSRFPELQGRTLLSSGGGTRPFWRRDGREVFYLSADGRVMVVPLTPSPTTLVPGKPTELFRATLYENVYTSDADGRRFLVARPAPATETVPFEILVNPLR